MVKINCNYEILEPLSVINPNTLVKGGFLIQSMEKRERRLKHIEIQLFESFKEFSGILPGIWGSWDRKTKVLDNWIIAKEVRIGSGETRKFDFNIRLPNTWAPKRGQNMQDWHLSLRFIVKIGSKSLPLAKCVLPVYKSSRPPSYTPPISEVSRPKLKKTQDVTTHLDDKRTHESDNEKFDTKLCNFCGEEIRNQAFYCEYCGAEQQSLVDK